MRAKPLKEKEEEEDPLVEGVGGKRGDPRFQRSSQNWKKNHWKMAAKSANQIAAGLRLQILERWKLVLNSPPPSVFR